MKVFTDIKTWFIFFITGLIVVSPFFVEAHVKWFTNLEPQKSTLEEIMSPLFIGLAIIAASVLAILPQILPIISKWEWSEVIDHKLGSLRPYSMRILKYGTVVALCIQVVTGVIFAPELLITEDWVLWLMWVSIVLFIVPHALATRLSAVIMIGLFGYMTLEYGVFHMLDYGFYIAIFVVLFMERTRFEAFGFPFLYLGTGLSLCWVAVEKWVYPVMALDIITEHHVPTFGFEPSIFIVFTAFIEFIVGYLLVVGILNRALAVLVTLIFFSTTLLFGFTEIIGHFMIHVLLLLFLIEGTSFYNPPVKMHQRKIDQIIFVFLNFIFVLATILLIFYRFA
ncbi:hypothetical protein [Halalkalibacter urbisdiaboli]|uniref:hypothetical protein n=1 Tax=Halalkalibacter urbisdiaboli TaxID=1960589 RepID=UPI000B4497BC|nr:hypothetical protein [Halalkalibacter urbisdiaboli]